MDGDPDTIVISGAGLATSLGLSAEETWQSILSGKCGIGPMSAIEPSVSAGYDGGQAVDLPADFSPNLAREVRYLRWTIDDALGAAGVRDGMPYPLGRCGILLGTTLHGMRSGGQFLKSGDFGLLRGFLAGSVLQGAAERLGVTGLAATTCAACSSGLAAVAMATTLLRNGTFDMIVAGGYDPISEYTYCGFNSLRLVSPGPVRPFARGRQGMKVAEGYAIVVLEREHDALSRGAKPLTRVMGCGESADAYHLTQPHPQGEGAARAINAALSSAGITSNDIDLVSAHATGTPDNDAGEYAALSHVFGSGLPRVPVVAFKSFLGHTLGAAGGVELILSAMAIRDQMVPGCANVRTDEVEFADLNLVTGSARSCAVRRTLNCSLGFGGANTCVVLESPDQAKMPARHEISTPHMAIGHNSKAREVVISGVGVVLPGAIGMEALAKWLGDETRPAPAWSADAGEIPEAEFMGFLAARRVRRMSTYVKLTLASAALALQDARMASAAALGAGCCAILGTSHGSTGYSREYYAQILKEGIAAANPVLFAEGVPNAAAAQLSLMLSLKGGCQTMVGTRTAAMEALSLAAARISSGEWDRSMVGAAEEYDPVTNHAYGACGLYSGAGGAPFGPTAGFAVGSGAVMFLLESAEACSSRGGRPRATLLDARMVFAKDVAIADKMRRTLEDIGPVKSVMSSANGTWIDRVEAMAIRSSATVVSSLYGHMPEMFSVAPLASIAAVLAMRRLPALLGGGLQNSDGAVAATGHEKIAMFTSLCTGYTGTAAVATLRVPG